MPAAVTRAAGSESGCPERGPVTTTSLSCNRLARQARQAVFTTPEEKNDADL